MNTERTGRRWTGSTWLENDDDDDHCEEKGEIRMDIISSFYSSLKRHHPCSRVIRIPIRSIVQLQYRTCNQNQPSVHEANQGDKQREEVKIKESKNQGE